MKKYSLTKKGNSRQTFFHKRIFFVIAVLAILLLLWLIVPVVVSRTAAVLLWPIETARVWFNESSNSLPTYLRDRTTLDTRIDDLEAKVAICEASDNTIAKLQAENNQFRQLCDAVPDERIIARVAARPPYLPYDVLMIDQGSVDGVVENAAVFLGSDQVIGYVSTVYSNTALVTLVTTANFTATAYVIGPNIYTYSEGIGGGMLRVRVPQGIPLHTGDVVVLPAIDSGVYGVITDIETSPTQPEQYGYVPLPLSLQSLQYVSVAREPIVTQSYNATEALIKDIRDDLFTVSLPPGVLVTPETASTTATTTAPAATSTGTAPGVVP